MYTPSRECGSSPSTTKHFVGGISFTGAKFPVSTNFGSTNGWSGGLIIILSFVLNVVKRELTAKAFLLEKRVERESSNDAKTAALLFVGFEVFIMSSGLGLLCAESVFDKKGVNGHNNFLGCDD
ncbi:hypothetical protein U1Q18_047928 [Sarracenia purpurea var. burkii]